MKESILKRCNLLVNNWEIIHKEFWLEKSLITTIAASSFAEKGITADPDTLKECQKILKKKQSVFSEFRGNNELVVCAKMALADDREKFLDDVITVYKKFQEGKFWDSSYRALAAMTIAETGRVDDADNIIERTNILMKAMNKAHPFLTNDEDTCFTTLLAMTDRSTDDILVELEDNYQALRKVFKMHENAAYALSQVITSYPGNGASKVDKVVGYYNLFRDAGYKYGKDYELASLGILTDFPEDKYRVVAAITSVADFLNGKKGFGMLDMSKVTRLMFGTMIVSSDYFAENYKAGASVISGAIARVIAEQTAMFLAIMATTTSTTAYSAST